MSVDAAVVGSIPTRGNEIFNLNTRFPVPILLYVCKLSNSYLHIACPLEGSTPLLHSHF